MLYYYKTHNGNFGDDLNPWLWLRLAPEVCSQQKSILFLGIATILSPDVPVKPFKVVFGAGSGPGQPPRVDDRWAIYCVRGPLTAAKLHLPSNLALTDPAILVRRFVRAEPVKIHSFSFMPHHNSMRCADWPGVCRRAGIHCIDPGAGVDRVLAEIRATKLLLAEAMHGAIVADALRVPWIPVRIYEGSEFKWRDWAASLQLQIEINPIAPIFTRRPFSRDSFPDLLKNLLARVGLAKKRWRSPLVPTNRRRIDEVLQGLEGLARTGSPRLSADRTLMQAEARMLEKLAELREGWKQHSASVQP